MDLIEVNRGNERLVERFDGMMRDLIASVLDLFDLLGEGLGILYVAEQLQQQTRPLNAFTGMLLEEVKETVLFRQECPKWHEVSFASHRGMACGSSRPTQAWVEGVADTVPKQVERQYRDGNSETWEEHEPPVR